MPKNEKWVCMLPNMERQIADKLGAGWDVALVDGSPGSLGGVEFAGYGVWVGEGDDRNESSPLLVTDRQSITRAELTAALRALQKKCRGIPLHLVTDLELVFIGLKKRGECDKWS